MTRIFPILLFIGLALGQTTIAVFDFENNGLEDYRVRQITRRIESQLIKHKGIGIFKNINNMDSNNVFILDTIYKQCGLHGGISAGFFNNDEYLDFYVSTANYHGPDWMEPDLDCLQQDFFYLGGSSGLVSITCIAS